MTCDTCRSMENPTRGLLFNKLAIDHEPFPNPYRAMLRLRLAREALAQLVGAAAVHPHAFDAADANELHTDVIAAVLFVGEIDEFLGGRREIAVAAGGFRHFGGADRSVQTVRAEQQHVARQYLDLIDFDVYEKVHPERAAENVAGGSMCGLVSGKHVRGAPGRRRWCDRG